MGYASRCGCLWLLLATCGHATEPATDIAGLIAAEGVDPDASAMLVLRLGDGRRWESNAARVDLLFVPASTSKIPHTLIALETGYAEGPDEFFAWDGIEREFDVWNQDQTLATAYARSAVWVYQRIAHDLGSEIMESWLERFEYGNHDVGGPEDLTRYWVEREAGSIWVFAVNLDMPKEALHAARVPLARAVLAGLGAIDTNNEKEN